MNNLGEMLKQAGQIQSRMQELQKQLAGVEVAGTSGGGMVRVTLNGKAEMREIKIDPSLVEAGGAEVLEDLVTAAFNDAKAKVEAVVAERMSELTGGLQLPLGMMPQF